MKPEGDLRGLASRIAPWAAVAVVTALLLVPLPLEPVARRWPSLVREVENIGHPLVFAWLAHILFRRLRARDPSTPGPYLWVLAAATVFAFSTEVTQAMIGRDSSWADLRNDMVGTAIALLLHARAEAGPRLFRAALLTAACASILVAAAPLTFTLAAYAHRAARMPVIWRSDTMLFGRLSHLQRGRFPGVSVNEPTPDWRGWAFLEVDVENPLDEPVQLMVRVHDAAHRGRPPQDRYNEVVTLPPRTRQTVQLPLERIRDAPATRTMDMSMIRGVIVFDFQPGSSPRFRLHELRLAN